MPQFSMPRFATATLVAGSMALTLALAALAPGCSPATLDVDKAALYTPESLAQELVVRFHALNPSAKTQSHRLKTNPAADKQRAERLARAEKAEKKGGGTPGAKKRQGAPTIDDLIADVNDKLDRIEGTSRAEACKKMRDAISKDNSVTDSERKTLADIVGQLAGES